MNSEGSKPSSSLSRRHMLQSAAGLAVGAAVLGNGSATHAADDDKKKKNEDKKKGGKLKGNINHSIVQWCFSEHWELAETCKQATKLGCKSIELVGPDDWPTLKEHGLTCAIAPNGMPGAPFIKGLNNPKYHDQVIGVTTKMIDECAKHGVPSVIAFNGYKWKDAEDPKSGEISLEEGAKNCVEGVKKMLSHAEKKKVTICIEMLNTRADDHPMKGHPGYQGDHTDYVVDIIKKVGSDRFKLLFDVYHVQIMDGDVIRRIGQLKDVIGHVHTAGNPGRGELNEDQEIQYPPVMQALVKAGYKGYVGHEFIPTGDPKKGLREAVKLCDV